MAETPALKAAMPAKDAPAKAPFGARALGALAFTAMAASLGLIAVTVAPAALRAAGVGAPPIVTFAPPPSIHAPPLPGLGAAAHPFFDDEEQRAELDRFPDAPGLATPGADLDTGRDPPGVRIEAGNAHTRTGTALRTFALLEEPDPAAHPSSQVMAEERVMIVKEQGDWLFVLHGGAETGSAGFGWAKKSEIAIR